MVFDASISMGKASAIVSRSMIIKRVMREFVMMVVAAVVGIMDDGVGVLGWCL